MIQIDGLEVLHMQVNFPHSNFDFHQFEFGHITLGKEDRSFKLDAKERSLEWADKGILLVPFFYPEDLEI